MLCIEERFKFGCDDLVFNSEVDPGKQAIRGLLFYTFSGTFYVMTYKEAFQLKAKQASTFKEDGITYKVFVTPENHEDLMKYLTDIRGFYSHLTDSVAKKYSKNGQFFLYGLHYNRPNILFKKL